MAHVYSIRRIPISWYLGLVWLRTFMYVYVQLDTLVLMVSSYHSHDTKSCSHLIMSNIPSIEFRAHRIVSVCVCASVTSIFQHFEHIRNSTKFNDRLTFYMSQLIVASTDRAVVVLVRIISTSSVPSNIYSPSRCEYVRHSHAQYCDNQHVSTLLSDIRCTQQMPKCIFIDRVN